MWCVRRRNWILFCFTFPLTVFELQFLCSVAHKSSSSSSRTTTPTSTPASSSSSWAKVNTTNRERERDNNITHRRESGSGPGEWKWERENSRSKLKAQRADSLLFTKWLPCGDISTLVCAGITIRTRWRQCFSNCARISPSSMWPCPVSMAHSRRTRWVRTLYRYIES